MKSERHFEVIKRYVEIQNEKELIDCLEKRLETSLEIGFGNNGNVYSLEDESGIFAGICVKKIKEKPLLMCNDIDTEAQYQRKLRKGGLKTPRYLIVVKDENDQKYFIMERIRGVSIGDAIINPKLLPKEFSSQDFCSKLEKEVQKMHSLGVIHRDLHTGNVMIDEDCNPVIIDFGTATESDSNSDYAYEESVAIYNKDKNVYEFVSGYFRDDDYCIDVLKANVRHMCRKEPQRDQFGNLIG